MLRKIFKILFNRISIIAVLLCVQIGFFILLMMRGAAYSQYITWGLTLISLLVVQSIASTDEPSEFKLAWCIPILIFPIFGGLLYLIIRLQSSNDIARAKKSATGKLPPTQDEDVLEELSSINPTGARQAWYAISRAGYPVYKNSQVKYLRIGEVFFEELLARLEGAEEFIFMEYFIIAPGKMWDSILEVLKRKARAGVEVRVMYDSMGSLLLLPSGYYRQLEKEGIKCVEFNRFRPAMSSIQNNRDHRKICVVDGRVAFTGGINIGDEYINARERCGHWKDNGVMVSGEAVKSFTAMFLEMWSYASSSRETETFGEKFFPVESDGFVMPYGDIPGDGERVCESIYLNIISRANRYLYITTPYFIVGEEFITALELAAKGGVDVRIITPRIWDKRFVHITTRSYYRRLIDAGVRVYEYTPGFIHAKTFICDGVIATVGTANLDYRSLYHHYECGTWLHGCSCIENIKDDILGVLQISHEVTMEECTSQPLRTRIAQSIMRVFSPLF